MRKVRQNSLKVDKVLDNGELDTMHRSDVETDKNSVADIAISTLSRAPKRFSLSLQPSPLKAEAGKGGVKVEGRAIRQDHALYGLTYGMMLGIRVMTGRRELFNYGHLQGKNITDEGDNLSSRDLTDEDYDYELELKFPPDGSRVTPTQPIVTPAHKLHHPFKFKDYMANVFRSIRSFSGIDEAEYMMSVAGDFNYIEFLANSKSGQFFFYSHDGKYMIKTQTKQESKFLREIMPQYVSHLADHPNSLLVRFYGMHRVKMSFMNASIYFVIMSSVFHTDLPIHVKYDIKGSTIGRAVKEEECNNGSVQKDINLLESGRVIRLGEDNSKIFVDTITHDALFLKSLGIMDYSLLIGIHELNNHHKGRRYSGVVPAKHISLNISKSNSEASHYEPSIFTQYQGGIVSCPSSASEPQEVYFLGIIDILQSYDARKRMETVFKSLIGNDVRELSAVDPKFYAERFITFNTARTDYNETNILAKKRHQNSDNRQRRSPVSSDNYLSPESRLGRLEQNRSVIQQFQQLRKPSSSQPTRQLSYSPRVDVSPSPPKSLSRSTTAPSVSRNIQPGDSKQRTRSPDRSLSRVQSQYPESKSPKQLSPQGRRNPLDNRQRESYKAKLDML